jgi:hypothetical protein
LQLLMMSKGAEKIATWLHARDLEVKSSLEAPCACEGHCEHTRTVYFVQTFEDTSVGIFGEQVTPVFATIEELVSYVEAHKSDIDTLYFA